MFLENEMTVRRIMDEVGYDDIINFSKEQYNLTERDYSEILKIYRLLEEAKKKPVKEVKNHSIVILDSPNYDACYATIRGGMPFFVYSFDEYIDMRMIKNTSEKYNDILPEEMFLIFLLSMRVQYADREEKLPLWDEYIYKCEKQL